MLAQYSRDCKEAWRQISCPCPSTRVRTIFRLAFFRLTFIRPQIFVPQFFVSHFFVSQFFVSRIFVWQFFVWVFFRLNYFSSVHSFVRTFFRSYIFSSVHFFVFFRFRRPWGLTTWRWFSLRFFFHFLELFTMLSIVLHLIVFKTKKKNEAKNRKKSVPYSQGVTMGPPGIRSRLATVDTIYRRLTEKVMSYELVLWQWQVCDIPSSLVNGYDLRNT